MSSAQFSTSSELPPRARRIRRGFFRVRVRVGTTSACAENTLSIPQKQSVNGNYLRVRGEYRSSVTHATLLRELPPRARRIHVGHEQGVTVVGTTSACAENTGHGHDRMVVRWNYLRVRGEYMTRLWDLPASVELPPRARRIHAQYHESYTAGGTTSACAENTKVVVPVICDDGELPPRARRIPRDHHYFSGGYGTTSACAENTFPPGGGSGDTWNYLRVRGEYRF